MDIYCLRMSISECPRMDIPAWISMWISTLVWIIEDCHPKIMDIHIDMDFWKSTYGYDMDSRTRGNRM